MTKTIKKFETKGGSNIRFLRYYKKVGDQDIAVDIFT